MVRSFVGIGPRDPVLQSGGAWRKTRLGVTHMSLGTILLIVLVLALIGVVPAWPHSRGWGYGPSGIVGVILVVLLILFLMGKL